jgi:hypothetical protein
LLHDLEVETDHNVFSPAAPATCKIGGFGKTVGKAVGSVMGFFVLLGARKSSN